MQRLELASLFICTVLDLTTREKPQHRAEGSKARFPATITVQLFVVAVCRCLAWANSGAHVGRSQDSFEGEPLPVLLPVWLLQGQDSFCTERMLSAKEGSLSFVQLV